MNEQESNSMQNASFISAWLHSSQLSQGPLQKWTKYSKLSTTKYVYCIVGTSGGTQQFAKIRVLKINYFPFPGSNLLQIMNKFSCTKFFHIIYFNFQQKKSPNLQINFFIEMPPDVILLFEIQWSAPFILQKSQAKLTLLRYPATAPTVHILGTVSSQHLLSTLLIQFKLSSLWAVWAETQAQYN